MFAYMHNKCLLPHILSCMESFYIYYDTKNIHAVITVTHSLFGGEGHSPSTQCLFHREQNLAEKIASHNIFLSWTIWFHIVQQNS